jgi:aminoglycoside phosphotransferase (APT) family kinase protein
MVAGEKHQEVGPLTDELLPEIRAEHGFDAGRLERWMQAHIADYGGPLRIEQFSGGQSNPTFQLSTPQVNYVLRRKPPGPLLKGAHAIEREARVISALRASGFPVPHVYGSCSDEGVIGTPFFIMERVQGKIFWDATFPGVGSTERRRYFEAMNGTIARLHRLDFAALGLGDFGARGNYLERQISRWSRQYLQDEAAGRDLYMERLVEWLPQHIPAGGEISLVHGDFRSDNLMFDPGGPRVIAVLDWELSTLGHPVADFAYHLMMYRVPPRGVAGLLGADLRALNIPTESEYVAAYCERTGRRDIAHLNFYLAFNLFRFAAILHGIRGRVLRGTAASSSAQDFSTNFPLFARIGWDAAQG